jgi:two-component system NtrC family sensor kinase
MLNYRPSIRQKVTFGYYAIVAMIIGLSLVTYLELRFVERKIIFGEAISEFFDTTLEIRRFEKNYFLYEQQSDYSENSGYVAKARELLENNLTGFSALASAEQVEKLADRLSTYQTLMDEYAELNRGGRAGPRKTVLEAKIRAAGKDIITTGEDISKTERKRVQALLNTSQRVLIFSIVLLSVAVIAIGRVLSWMVVKPLKLIEKNMEVIADGRFEKIEIDSREREIASLTNAFNKMLRELELRQRHLIQSEKLASLGTLLSGVAHELNNPLSNISSSNQILIEELKEALEKQPDGPLCLDTRFVGELLSQINDQADRARNIVRSLLEFSRDKDFKKQRMPVKTLFEETIRFVKGQIPANTAIALDIPEDLVITADKQRIQQAFLNLIKNALDAVADVGGGVITVTAKGHSALDKAEDDTGIYNYLKYRGKCTLEEDTIDIQVHDSGPGIPGEALSKIFDPFFTTKDVGRGSGLGLFIVHEIIEEHDGCIAVDSEPGKGSTFLIRLPEKRVATVANEREETRPQ